MFTVRNRKEMITTIETLCANVRKIMYLRSRSDLMISWKYMEILIYIYLYLNIHICIYVNIEIHVYIYTYICIYVNIYIHVNICIYINVYLYVCKCMYMYIYICLFQYLYVYKKNLYTEESICISTYLYRIESVYVTINICMYCLCTHICNNLHFYLSPKVYVLDFIVTIQRQSLVNTFQERRD